MNRPFRRPVYVGGYCVNSDDIDMCPLSPEPTPEGLAALDEYRRQALAMTDDWDGSEIPFEAEARV